MKKAGGGRRPATGRARYRRHELTLPDGGRLALDADGTIRQLAEDGTATTTWAVDDPGWPDMALRFGIRPQDRTIVPRDRDPGSTWPGR